jgi:hypothetical protein
MVQESARKVRLVSGSVASRGRAIAPKGVRAERRARASDLTAGLSFLAVYRTPAHERRRCLRGSRRGLPGRRLFGFDLGAALLDLLSGSWRMTS